MSMSTPSPVRQIQGASCVRADVRPAVVRPAGGLWQREDPRTLHTQHSARLLLLLQVGININQNMNPQTASKPALTFAVILSHDPQIPTPQCRSKQSSSFILLSLTIYKPRPPHHPSQVTSRYHYSTRSL